MHTRVHVSGRSMDLDNIEGSYFAMGHNLDSFLATREGIFAFSNTQTIQVAVMLLTQGHVILHFVSRSPCVDIAELDGGKVVEIEFPNPNDLTTFNVNITPDTGYWAHATYNFTFTIPPHYPHSPPKVDCNTKIYHPNINLDGKVCLNILREDWKPVLDINAVIYGLCFLFYQPNPEDPLNHEAAELFRKDVKQFERLVARTLRGGMLDGVYFEKLVK